MVQKRLLDIRLAVGSVDGPSSSTWRIWSSKSDVYIVFGNLGHIEKLSFHSVRAGKFVCRKAFTAEYGTPDGLTDRCMIQWERNAAPPEGLGGGTCVFEVCFPTDFLSNLPISQAPKMKLVRPAPRGMATVLEMFFTREPWEEVVRIMGVDRVITYTKLPSTEAFVIARRDADFAGEEFVIPAANKSGHDLIFVKNDPQKTGRPIRFWTHTTPKDGDHMSAWEYGGYKGRAADEPRQAELSIFRRQKVLAASRGNL